MKKLQPEEAVRHKHFLRGYYRELVREISFPKRRAAALALARRVGGLVEFRQARSVGVFLPLSFEIETAPLIALARREGKTVAVPVVFPEERRLRFAVLPDGRPRWVKNVYGIREPFRRDWVDRLDLLLVPGAAFTLRGDRLGSGAGYYDRYLARRPRPKTIGVCFDEQVAVRLPVEKHDHRMEWIVTPTRTRHV
ncbi:MAG: 5-formyltetrahydrofolate cyclo-ligase [Elusimicrobia bacterium]|nr:5-formyltetrahydrofolate cyclo-ligase [Elusimicrobiota bacterium]